MAFFVGFFMDSTSLLHMLHAYTQQILPTFTKAPWFHLKQETEIVSRFYSLLAANTEVVARTAWNGHLTASGLLVSEDSKRVALTFHKKLGMWLQFGGHVEAQDKGLLEAAQRETREESGCHACEIFPTPTSHLPLDLDIHALPPLGTEPAHLHFDVRFLLYTREQTLITSHESNDVRWFSFEEALHRLTEPSMQRLLHKALWRKQNG